MIKSTAIVSDCQPSGKYPCLKVSKSTGTIVLFTREKIGFVVHSEDWSKETIEYTAPLWNENNFTDFHGKVVLEG